MIALAWPLHVVALILVVSGIQKLLHPTPAGDAIAAARLPGTADRARAAGLGVGALEASVGVVGLVVPSGWAAVAVAAVYAAFNVFILRLRHFDDSASCGCFGASTTPPGLAHLAFNAGAVAIGVGVSLAGVPDIVDIFGRGIGIAMLYLVTLAGGAGGALIGLARLSARPNAAVFHVVDDPAPAPADPAPPVAADAVPVEQHLLAFLSPSCDTCAHFWSAFAAGVDLPDATDLAVWTEDVDGAIAADYAAQIAGVADAGIVVTHDSSAWSRYDVPVSPYFVLVDHRGRVRAEGAANTWDRVRALLG